MLDRRWVAALAAVTLLSGCGGDVADTAAAPAARLPDPGVAHVHGLGVDPADGTLYAATHTGLFALPEAGPATRVAQRMQDTMGFSVTGPRTFLGSGHPDVSMDPELPARLGLIRSTDAGQTWRAVSLTGEADFHVLRQAHGLVYGYDATSGTLLTSEDGGRSWDRRSSLELRDLAVSPADADVLLATTPRGLARTDDRGATFSPVAGPALVVLSWPSTGELYGIDVVGTVHHSPDGGRSWTERGRIGGEPEALSAEADGRVHAAVRDRGIVASRDGGRTWSVRYPVG